MERKRAFAILNWKKERKENVENKLVAKLPLREDDDLLIFYREADYPDGKPDYKNGRAKLVAMSEEAGKNRASAMNFLLSYLKENYAGKNVFAHTIVDSIAIAKDLTSFLDEIEKMMSKLKLDIWLNTYTDRCNFVFSKFDGRVSVAINEPELKAIYDKTIIWTSHSNPNWMCVDLDKFEIGEDKKVFDDRFDIPMFWIIKFLCERARDKKGFMNHYPTIAEEIGAFKSGNFIGIEPSPEQMKKEDELFRTFELDHSPNMSVEALMDFMIERLKS